MDLHTRQQRAMRIIFSRKGFDSATGGGPSPIVDGRPVSLPIPTAMTSRTTYDDLGLGEHVRQASRGRIDGNDACHHDPMFLADGTCLFGQSGAAQTHLRNNGVRAGDAFLFFGLFRAAGGLPHHRIFGYLVVEAMIDLADCPAATREELAAFGHPHALAMHGHNDAIWRGRGRQAESAPGSLRLTAPGETPSIWNRPGWLCHGGLTYHDCPDRWLAGGRLRAVSRGQEFVADVGKLTAPREWLATILRTIDSG